MKIKASTYTLATYIFIECLFYSPFVFFAFINEFLRLFLFGILILTLLISIFLVKKNKIRISTLLYFSSLFLLFFSGSLYANNGDEGVRSALGYSMIFLFSILIYNLLLNRDDLFKIIVNIYVIFFNIVTISILLNFIFNLFLPSINILTSFFPNNFGYDYNASPFGLSISKNFMGINISRNFYFFVEPVYTAPFFLINILICNSTKIFKSNKFLYLNLIGGVLSSSFLFFVGLSLLFINSLRKIIKYPLFFGILLFAIFVFLNIDDENPIFASSSSSDRIDRIQLALELLPQFGFNKIIFGGGYLLTQNLDKGISSGMFSSVIEGGIIGLFIPFLFILEYIRKNSSLLIICVLSLLTIEIYKMPLFWLAIILGGLLINKKDEKL
jgi:hypothetical protein